MRTHTAKREFVLQGLSQEFTPKKAAEVIISYAPPHKIVCAGKLFYAYFVRRYIA